MFDRALIEQARQQHPEWCEVPPDLSAKEFAAFAKEYGGLTFREAHAIFAKHDFWEARNDVSRYHDEPQQSA